MKIDFHIDGVVLSAKQKSFIEKKIGKLKRYLNHLPEDTILDVYLSDDSGPEKAGVDQRVALSVIYGKEKIFVEETSDRLMRAFAFALKKFDNSLRDLHEREVSIVRSGGRFDKVLKMIRRKRRQ